MFKGTSLLRLVLAFLACLPLAGMSWAAHISTHAPKKSQSEDQREPARTATPAPPGAQPQRVRHFRFCDSPSPVSRTLPHEFVRRGHCRRRRYDWRRSHRPAGRRRCTRQHEWHGGCDRAHQWTRVRHGQPETGPVQRRAALLHHQAFRSAGCIERRARLKGYSSCSWRPQPHESDHGTCAFQQRLLRGAWTQTRL